MLDGGAHCMINNLGAIHSTNLQNILPFSPVRLHIIDNGRRLKRYSKESERDR